MPTPSHEPRALVIRHVAFEDLGLLAPLLRERQVSVTYHEASRDDLTQHDPQTPDLAVVLGGPIGVYEDESYPFLREEVTWLEQRLAAGRATLGICLGAQLMARALGARVYPGPFKEIGWSPIALTEAGKQSCLASLGAPEVSVLHWHGDTFDLPDGAVRLASTAAYENQAFAWQQHGLALQFHPEVTAVGLEGWFVGHAVEIRTRPDLSVDQLRNETRQHTDALAAAGRAWLSTWLDSVWGKPDTSER